MSVIAPVLALVLIVALGFVGNVVGLVLAIAAFSMARMAQGDQPLSRGGKLRASWGTALAIIVGIACIGLVFVGL